MGDFDQNLKSVGLSYIKNQIDVLEEARPGWMPMFYFTLSYEGDIAEADRLRALFDMPRPDEMSERLRDAERSYKEYRKKEQERKRLLSQRPWWRKILRLGPKREGASS